MYFQDDDPRMNSLIHEGSQEEVVCGIGGLGVWCFEPCGAHMWRAHRRPWSYTLRFVAFDWVSRIWLAIISLSIYIYVYIYVYAYICIYIYIYIYIIPIKKHVSCVRTKEHFLGFRKLSMCHVRATGTLVQTLGTRSLVRTHGRCPLFGYPEYGL